MKDKHTGLLTIKSKWIGAGKHITFKANYSQ